MAKASSLAQNLVKELECAVCLEQYKEPKVLPCLHSYCKKCLEGLLTKQGVVWKISCPSCRISVEIPEGEVDSLPVNFCLNNLLSMVSLHGDSESSNLECDNCDSGDPPVNRCATCCHFLCEFCTAGHKRGRNTKAHRLMSLEEAKEEGPVAVTRPSLCKEHEGEVLKLFCETCDEAICRDCTIVKHREHKYTFVKDAFSKGKENVLKILSETKRKASVLKEALDGVAEMKRSVQSHAEQTAKEVFSCFQELTACLNTRCNELICSVEEFKKAKLKSLEIQQGELETALGSVQSSVEFTERALELGSEVDILNMRKQMSCRLQELNSARWQLEPSAHDRFKFLPDCQLQQALPSFGDVTDVFTHAGSSTVTMGHGSEGVMYNTLNGQLIEFSITAKELNGRKRTEGGDVFEVEISTEEGEIVFNDPSKDCGNGTYSFCFSPIHGDMEHQLSVKLNGCHVRGSPFAWFNETWNLCTEVHDVQGYSRGRSPCYIQFTENNMKATIQRQLHPSVPSRGRGRFLEGDDMGARSKQLSWQRAPKSVTEISPLEDYLTIHQLAELAAVSRQVIRPRGNDMKATVKRQPSQKVLVDSVGVISARRAVTSQPYQELNYSDGKWTAFGSSSFGSGKHSWKVCISGEFTAGFAFGVGGIPHDQYPCDSQWTWSSGHKYHPPSQCQQSVIANCMNNDVIEFYLDCDNETLVMYNQRTRQLDTWRGIQGEVCPLFELCYIGDEVSLPCQLTSSQGNSLQPDHVKDYSDEEMYKLVW